MWFLGHLGSILSLYYKKCWYWDPQILILLSFEQLLIVVLEQHHVYFLVCVFVLCSLCNFSQSRSATSITNLRQCDILLTSAYCYTQARLVGTHILICICFCIYFCICICIRYPANLGILLHAGWLAHLFPFVFVIVFDILLTQSPKFALAPN